VLLAFWGEAAAGGPVPLEFKDGDRIILIGDDLVERDQKFGYLETLISLRNPGKDLIIRNLGWSGDTVFGDARAGFGTRADGFKHLKEHVLALRPTVVIVGYGMSGSFDGAAGLPSFEAGLKTLLETLRPTGARFLLLSPIAHEDLGRPLPDPTKHNRDLPLYRRAIQNAAASRGWAYLDLDTVAGPLAGTLDALGRGGRHLTDDGIHLTETGYWFVDSAIAEQLAGARAAEPWSVRIDPSGEHDSTGVRLSQVHATPERTRFEALSDNLPAPRCPSDRPAAGPPHRVFHFGGLKPGRYTLKIDGAAVASAPAEEWESMRLDGGPEFDQVERLRQTINEKNLLYFHRWRPQNETYLFGFRKYEQGNNAREIPLFDPLVEEKERQIARLRVPVPHVYELVREGEVGR
jgi:lysophospholipase L1-like esterase